ncbi:hypothetical protein SAMN03097699_1762 [Flavobacteriaceae bacterium MAR_2010_188]|nr:hypothetical protein SAMN03097699_1762 [Flavobacteriaceae bacterium MAR_2010_188]
MILKKIFFPLFSVFLAYRTWILMEKLGNSLPSHYSVGQSIILAFILTLVITGIFAFIGFAYPTNKLLPHSYYKIKNPIVLNTAYKWLGLRYFKYLLLLTFWGKKDNRKKYFNGTKQGLKNFIFQTKQSEFGHLAAFILILICSLILLYQRHYFIVFFMTLFNITGNIYPVLLQRFHRLRVDRFS